MNWLKELISEQSTLSTMRVMSLLCIFAAIGIAFYGIAHNQALDALSILCGVFLGAGMGGKVAQKGMEKNE